MMKYLFLTGSVFGLDTFLKARMREADPGEKKGKWLTRRVMYNKGFAGSRLEDRPEVVKAATVSAMAVLVPLLVQASRDKGAGGLTKAGLFAAAGGALSNASERLLRGEVTDYCSLRTGDPRVDRYVFNLSDVMIAAGSAAALAGQILHKKG